ncbi:subtilisin-like protease SBT3.9 [Malania oleifera]|uniref:subtilisin-like protease SBT3.9 n=1 Tax=Malania oleifera TaxID=397392 RepID=UPI0025ADAC42|nr:subtilisin-like protease SBT3.9 [Malania oleifera]
MQAVAGGVFGWTCRGGGGLCSEEAKKGGRRGGEWARGVRDGRLVHRKKKKKKKEMDSLRTFGIALLVLAMQHMFFCLVQPSNVYIVYMGATVLDNPQLTEDSHYKVLIKLLGSKEEAMKSMLYSYKNGFSGFAAMLSESQANNISGFPQVLDVFSSRNFSVHTTRSWDFLQVKSQVANGILNKSHNGSGSIIGMLDTGIWPESESFNDGDMGPIPSHWKGICQEGEKFNLSNCNRKIIGARWYVKGYEAQYGNVNSSDWDDLLSPRDQNGHGTHVASTAAGAFVQNASFLGLAQGLARGGAPSACLAIYKICWTSDGHCAEADILAAFDDAIYDGVDVLSASFGSPVPLAPYFAYAVSIGSFHAAAKGISVVCAAGNDGPFAQTVQNTAPWLISVAASTIDRSFPTPITLGNNQTFVGQALNTRENVTKLYPFWYGVDLASIGASYDAAKSCQIGSLNATLTRRRVVLCFQTQSQSSVGIAQSTVFSAGGVGLIFAQAPTKEIVPSDQIPVVQVDNTIGTSLWLYWVASSYPKVKISPTTTTIGKQIAPEVASFSSRGPNSLSPAVLKPDIAAPGVDILAAWSPSSLPYTNFNVLSGTSMACPHISAVVALIKSIYPTWSPAAIKSALVTTASIKDVYGQHIVAEGLPSKRADPFDFGGGVVNPNKAIDPGLVFDMETSDYVNFLCSMGYDESVISQMTRMHIQCNGTTNFSENLNLPSISVPELKTCLTISRTATNVGPENSWYISFIEAPPGISMIVEPPILLFNGASKKINFKITLCSQLRVQGRYSFGYIYWTNPNHLVRMPITVRPIIEEFYADA